MSIRGIINTVLISGLVCFSPVLASAQSAVDETFAGPIRAYLKDNVEKWLSDPIVIDAINEQNEWYAYLTPTEISTLDEKWRIKIEGENHPIVDKVLSNDLSKFLTEKQDASNEMLTEIFVMDAKGLNVGQSKVTSDYWQGDEAKWTKTFLKGPDALFIDDIDIDDSTLKFQSQASMTITDPETGKAIGAITLGFNIEKLPL